MSLLIDLQGYKGVYNEFILKEIAVINNGNELQHFIVKPPYELNKLPLELQYQAKWLQFNHHGLGWTGGTTSLYDVIQLLKPILLDNKLIYVKGPEKGDWLNQIFKIPLVVEDLHNLGCPNLQILKRQYNNDTSRCFIHKGRCALENVFLIKKFLNCRQIKD